MSSGEHNRKELQKVGCLSADSTCNNEAIRLNCDEQDLAYRFGVSQLTVSHLFNNWIVIMAQRLSLLFYWPSKDEDMKSMPQTFKKFDGRCIFILDRYIYRETN